jgi:hypothetical protein
MAQDQDGNGNIFQGGMEVVPIGQPLLLSQEEAARWKPLALFPATGDQQNGGSQASQRHGGWFRDKRQIKSEGDA